MLDILRINILIRKLKDLFVDRLVQQVDMLREQISMYENQLKVQSESKFCFVFFSLISTKSCTFDFIFIQWKKQKVSSMH